MRQSTGSPVIRRAAAALLAVVFMVIVAMPMTASAATYRSTLRVSPRYQHYARAAYMSGQISRTLRGKYVTVEIRKPGRSWWDKISSRKIASNGHWTYKYTPKLAGRFYIRVRYGSRTSRVVSVTVKHGKPKTLIYMASTTSTRDSGIWEALKPAFLHTCPEYADVPAVFVGSGASIQQGKDKNVDVVLAHAASLEIPAVDQGYFKDRHSVMYNDFVLVGPKTNPAGVVFGGTPNAAFQAVATAGVPFLSRNDNSGTNVMEKSIWSAIGNPQTGQSWYLASGTMGMAEALAACQNHSPAAYTLSDRATWLNWQSLQGGSSKVSIGILNDNPPLYKNQYSVMSVVGARNWEGAMDFNNWIRSPEAQTIIRNYGLSTYGQSLFFPNAGLY